MLKRPRAARRSRHTAEAEELIRLATGLAASSHMAEDRFWQDKLAGLIHEVLVSGEEETLNTALDTLVQTDSIAWNELADVVESCSETTNFMHDGKEWQAVLVAAPILCWSRYAIPSGPLGREITQLMRVQLCAHVLAGGVKLSVADYLFSPDQLPQGYCNTAQLTEALAESVMRNGTLAIDTRNLPPTQQFLSDTRYVLAVAACPKGEPLFRWQESDGDREEAQSQWQKQGGGALQPVFAGCAFAGLLWRLARSRSCFTDLRHSCHSGIPATRTQCRTAPDYGRHRTLPRPPAGRVPHRLYAEREPECGAWRGLAFAGW